MNVIQKAILLIGTMITLALVCFPPWKNVLYGEDALNYRERSLGHGFILEPPTGARYVAIDTYRLLILVGLVAVATGGGVWVFRGQRVEEKRTRAVAFVVLLSMIGGLGVYLYQSKPERSSSRSPTRTYSRPSTR